MKFYIQCYQNINWSLSTFDENHSTGGAVILGRRWFRFQVHEIAQKLNTNYVSLETRIIKFG